MIIVKIKAGLGNQLFQYATARAMGLRSGEEVKMDITDSLTRDDHDRVFGLQNFNIQLPVATAEEIQRILSRRKWLRKKSRYFQNKTGIALHRTWWNQTYVYQTSYDKAIMKPAKRDIYIDGFWQNEDFFKEYRPLLLQELSVKNKPDAINQSVIDKMRSVNAVSLHVRRGDNLRPAAMTVYCMPDEEYYTSAISYIAGKMKDPHFFVFSDDIEWAKENMKTGFPTDFMDHNNDAKNYEDLRLMNNCRHHIIANSTFSWWGAWLNPSNDKIVISPRHWFNLAKFNRAKIIPSNWIKM